MSQIDDKLFRTNKEKLARKIAEIMDTYSSHKEEEYWTTKEGKKVLIYD